MGILLACRSRVELVMNALGIGVWASTMPQAVSDDAPRALATLPIWASRRARARPLENPPASRSRHLAVESMPGVDLGRPEAIRYAHEAGADRNRSAEPRRAVPAHLARKLLESLDPPTETNHERAWYDEAEQRMQAFREGKIERSRLARSFGG